MDSIKFIFNFKNEKAFLAEDVLDEMHKDSNMFIDKIGPGRVIFEKTLKEYEIETFPVIIVGGSGHKNEIKIEGEKYFKDRTSIKKAISDALMEV